MIDPELLQILVCPVSYGKLEYDAANERLICRKSRLTYPLVDGIPVLLAEDASPLEPDEQTNEADNSEPSAKSE